MRLLLKDTKKGIIRFRVTTPEDLWHLSQIIDSGDMITAFTSRKIRIGDGENAKTAKKTFMVTITAEEAELADRVLRVKGKILEGPDFAPKGSYHTIELEEGSECTLKKEQWHSYQWQRLEQAMKQQHTYLLCLLDREEALLAITKNQGFEVISTLQGDVPKKHHAPETKQEEHKKDFYQEIISLLQQALQHHHPERIIIASPAFYKDTLLEKITDFQLRQKITTASCSDVSTTSLDEVLKRPELQAILQESRLREEKLLMDELLKELRREGSRAAYGWKEVSAAGEAGAIEKIMVSNKFIQDERRRKRAAELEHLLQNVEKQQGTVVLIQESKILDGLGGIAALLRYRWAQKS